MLELPRGDRDAAAEESTAATGSETSLLEFLRTRLEDEDGSGDDDDVRIRPPDVGDVLEEDDPPPRLSWTVETFRFGIDFRF